MKYDILMNGVGRSIVVPEVRGDRPQMTAIIDGRTVEADVAIISPGVYSVLLGNRSLDVLVEEKAGSLVARAAGREFRIEIRDPRSWRSRRAERIELEGRQQVTSPMPGKVVNVLAMPGQKVEAGQGLLVIEAMKMQNEIRSPKSGIVEHLPAREGQTVSAGEVLAVIA